MSSKIEVISVYEWDRVALAANRGAAIVTLNGRQVTSVTPSRNSQVDYHVYFGLHDFTPAEANDLLRVEWRDLNQYEQLGIKQLVGEVEVGLRPDASRAQTALHMLVNYLDIMQRDWQDVQRRVQDANDRLRWREADLKVATEALRDIADGTKGEKPSNYQEEARYWQSRHNLFVGIASETLDQLRKE